MAAALPNAEPIHKVTIVPRGRAMGVPQQLPERVVALFGDEAQDEEVLSGRTQIEPVPAV